MAKKEKVSAEIQEQLDFIEWLKSNGIYDPRVSDPTRMAMRRVWKKMKKEVEKVHLEYAEDAAGPDI